VVRALPLGHRQVVTLLLEGLSQREIAEVLGTTENAVNVRASRARTAMRALLEEDDRAGETRR
jgi:RNA polymerase sigma-70 factor (ECF subfamily)